jgi:hypothetical protein
MPRPCAGLRVRRGRTMRRGCRGPRQLDPPRAAPPGRTPAPAVLHRQHQVRDQRASWRSRISCFTSSVSQRCRFEALRSAGDRAQRQAGPARVRSPHARAGGLSDVRTDDLRTRDHQCGTWTSGASGCAAAAGSAWKRGCNFIPAGVRRSSACRAQPGGCFGLTGGDRVRCTRSLPRPGRPHGTSARAVRGVALPGSGARLWSSRSASGADPRLNAWASQWREGALGHRRLRRDQIAGPRLTRRGEGERGGPATAPATGARSQAARTPRRPRRIPARANPISSRYM